ncbi:MAG: hypothetical protein ACREAF_01645 [Nitrosopumilaceae archaeon]
MVLTLDLLAKTLLDAPIGYVEQTLSEILRKPVHLDVVEQNSISGTKYIRKVVISASQFPIVNAVVKFDSKVLPESIMSDLLQKKEGIGNILRKNNILSQRRIVLIDVDPNRKKITRNYEILHKDTVWFQVSEEIRLDFLSGCQNS